MAEHDIEVNLKVVDNATKPIRDFTNTVVTEFPRVTDEFGNVRGATVKAFQSIKSLGDEI
jgi:hypothetical protein